MAAEAFEKRSGGQLPADDDDFLPSHQIPSHADGDFPPSNRYLMHQLLPSEIVSSFGEAYETVFNGTHVRSDPKSVDEVVNLMRERRLEVVEDVELVQSASRPLSL